MISPHQQPQAPTPAGKGNELLRMIVLHWALGGVLGIFFAAALLALNPLGLRTLLLHSDAMIVGLIMLFVGFATTFGGIVAATAIMLEKKDDDEDDDEPPSGGLREKLLGQAEPALIPIRISGQHSTRGPYRRV